MRPLSQGDGALALDCERLSAILRRVMVDPKRNEESKKEIARHIKAAMKLILSRSSSLAKVG